MACPQTADCVARSVLTINGFTFGVDAFPDNGDVISHGSTEVPDPTVQRRANGEIVALKAKGYALEEVTARVNPCDPVYYALYQSYIQGNVCIAAAAFNNPCCTVPEVWDEGVITSMTRAGTTWDEAYATITFIARVQA